MLDKYWIIFGLDIQFQSNQPLYTSTRIFLLVPGEGTITFLTKGNGYTSQDPQHVSQRECIKYEQ